MEITEDKAVIEQINNLLNMQDEQGLVDLIESVPSNELVHILFKLSPDSQQELIKMLPAGLAAEIIEEVPESHAVDVLEELEPEKAASIVSELPSNERVDILQQFSEAEVAEILSFMEEEDAHDTKALIDYPPDTAGGLMMTEYFSYPKRLTVKEVIADLTDRSDEYALYNVQYLYVVHTKRKLLGVLRLRDLVLAEPDTCIANLAIEAETVNATDSLAQLAEFFDARELGAFPVVDERNYLLGIIRRKSVDLAMAEKSETDHQKSQGIISGEELRSMPTITRSRRRLSWLSINIVLNMIAASVIAMYESTLSAVIALAVFLPIVSDMSGCSGNQSVAVSMRELTLGIIRPNDVLRVWLKEISIGMINGLALGLLLALAAWLWIGNPVLGAVVGVALMLNTMVAVSIGGTVPLILKRLNVDPAIASGPVLTTITDMCGFFLVLGIATLSLPYLI